jgi:hypothetical protein
MSSPSAVAFPRNHFFACSTIHTAWRMKYRCPQTLDSVISLTMDACFGKNETG